MAAGQWSLYLIFINFRRNLYQDQVKGLFWSTSQLSCHLLSVSVLQFKCRSNLVKCLTQGHNKRTCRPIFTLILFLLKSSSGSCEYQLLKTFGMTGQGEPRSTDYELDALYYNHHINVLTTKLHNSCPRNLKDKWFLWRFITARVL